MVVVVNGIVMYCHQIGSRMLGSKSVFMEGFDL
jgi:hypothetical protein